MLFCSFVRYFVSFVLHPIQMYTVFCLLFRVLSISSFLLRRDAISNTLCICFCISLSVHVFVLYSRVLSTSTSYMRVFVALLSSLEFHTFPSAFQGLPWPTQFSCPHLCQSLLVC